MYTLTGRDRLTPTDSIIAVFDLDITSQSHITRAYLSRAEKEGRLESYAEDIPKSFLICSDGVLLCQAATATMLRRIENNAV